MKVKFILPGFKNMQSREFKSLMFRYWFPSLTIPILSALTPDYIERSFDDEVFDQINFDEDIDLVVISAMTAQVKRGYDIADFYRAKGVTVIMGGVHVSSLPEEALEHADSVIIGEAELVWKEMLNDFEQNKLKKIYHAKQYVSMDKVPLPDREIFIGKVRPKHGTINSVQATRGCPNNCSFCSVTNFFGNAYRYRNVDDIIQEILTLDLSKEICFVDDNIYGNRNYAKHLFRRLKELDIRWSGQGNINLYRDDELLQLCAESGCSGLLMGIESINEENLNIINKRTNHVNEYKEAIKKIQDRGIKILGSFIFGLDQDTSDIFEKTLKFVEDTEISLPAFNILTPYPGTRIAKELEKDGRIFSYDWSDYTATKAVFVPKKMTVDELNEGYKWIYATVHQDINLKKL